MVEGRGAEFIPQVSILHKNIIYNDKTINGCKLYIEC